ncbi:hypothetical protein RUM44_002435 [Polyplax serrata]|uniref:Uncharacterized protein n=1 Tax=Polyplax serrata TaxID=468196 RepID=A0ABR1AER9_POLSC
MAKSTTDEFRSALKNRKTLSSLSNGEDNDFLSSTEERLEKAERKMITPGTSQWVAKFNLLDSSQRATPSSTVHDLKGELVATQKKTYSVDIFGLQLLKRVHLTDMSY